MYSNNDHNEKNMIIEKNEENKVEHKSKNESEMNEDTNKKDSLSNCKFNEEEACFCLLQINELSCHAFSTETKLNKKS